MATEAGLTLTRAAYIGRRTIKFGAIAIVALMVGRTFLIAASGYWRATHPPAPPPPTVGFGVLPQIRLPEQDAANKPSSYTLETFNGQLPKFEDRAKVFLMLHASTSLLADQRIKEIAAGYGFVFAPTILNDRTYRWNKSAPLDSTLEMDLLDHNFTLTTNYLNKPELLGGQNLPDEVSALENVKSFINSGVSLSSDIATSSGSVTYLRSLGNEFIPAVSLSDADFAQVDIMRQPVDGKYQFYSPEGRKGIIHAVLSSSLGGSDSIVHAEYHYQAADYLQRHTYPLRTVQNAWQLLQGGEGFIAVRGSDENIIIRDVYLGYYDDFEEQEYLQPIYVFEGDNNFLGFVPAIDPRYVQLAPALTE